MPGHHIVDNMVVVFETMHSLANRNNVKKGWMSLKLDMSKAYNQVEWNYIWEVMKQMGFGQRWIELVMNCITTARLSVFLNGTSKGSVVPT